ncbi:MAG: hypothetical protein MUC96_00845 [Myxococcaceae bacterium]|nr:hypothetical protein [Myxococcaceae bacterium]
MTQPLDGGVFAAGSQVPVEATLLLADGGAFPNPPSIPVRTSWGVDGGLVSGQPGLLAGLADAGVGEVTFGWSASTRQTRAVGFTSCESVQCEWFQGCEATTSGGRCINLPLDVRVTQPASDVSTRMASAMLQVTVTSRDGGPVPSRVPVLFPGASAATFIPRDGVGVSTYTQAVTLPGPDGVKVYVAGWDAGPGYVAERRVTLDTQQPMVTVVVPAAPPRSAGQEDAQATGAWKKDEVANVAVTVTDTTSPVEAVTTGMVSGVPSAAVTAVASSACASCVDLGPASLSRCFCFAVDMAQVPVNGLRQSGLAVLVNGALDRVGNVAMPAASMAFGVTRYRWKRDITLSSDTTPLQPVAVSRNGLVVVAVRERPMVNGGGRVVATNPNGTDAWEAVTTGTVTAGPVVGASNVWVATATGSGSTASTQLQSFLLAGGAQAATSCPQIQASPPPFTGDMALATLDGGTEFALGLREGFVSISRTGCPFYEVATPSPTNTAARPSLVLQTPNGTSIEAFVAYEADTILWKAGIATTSWLGQGSTTLPAGTQPRGLFMGGANFVGGGGGVVGNGSFFQASSVGLLSGAVTLSTPAANSGPAVRGASALFFGTVGSTLGRIEIQSGGALGAPSFTPALSIGTLQETTPVLGSGLVYAVGALGGTGTLTVRRQADMSEVWRGAVATTGGTAPLVSQMALDVYRDAAGNKVCPTGTPTTRPPLGVLYTLTKNSNVATLTAILVDSPGLDPTAPWPKYQRDNGNTGNINSDMSAWTCP